MANGENRILANMLDRLFAALVNGPNLNCRPHSSRQRIDLSQLAKLKDIAPEKVLQTLLSPERKVKLVARIPLPPRRVRNGGNDSQAVQADEPQPLTEEEKAAQKAWSEQQSLVNKLRGIAEDAKTYENDTGVHVLSIGFPLLSLPPGASGIQRGFSRRIVAPLAFVSLNLTVKTGMRSRLNWIAGTTAPI